MTANQEGDKNYSASQDLTTEVHAEYVVKRLEQFIRNGRKSDEGMSFKKWQNMAKAEIIKAFLEVKNQRNEMKRDSRILIFVSATAIVTIGFWGIAASLQRAETLTAGLICFFSGIIVFLFFGWDRYRNYKLRCNIRDRFGSLQRISSIDKRIRILERELGAEEKKCQEQLKKIRGSKSNS